MHERLKAAVELANIPTLACVLVHLTGERGWIEGRYKPTRTRGLDDHDTGGLPEDVRTEIRAAAMKALARWFAGSPPALPNPPDDLLIAMMSASLGEDIPLDYAPMIRHELRLPPAASGPATATAATKIACDTSAEGRPSGHSGPRPGFRALIIGAGISGLCAAVELAAAGVTYTIVERNDSVGGVWLENRYPGAACDVPSHLYSFSFAPHNWSRYFAGSREIHRYLEHVADEFDIRRRIRFGAEVIEARYDEAAQEWEVELMTADGRETLRANILISAVGAFNKPRLPRVPGLGSFLGPSVHTACYPKQGLDLAGRRVVVIGNGASAMQVVPAIVDEVASLTIVQRTPQWAAPFPKFKVDIPESLQWFLEAMPLYRRWYRVRLSWAFNDKLYEALQQDPGWKGDRRSINAINDGHRKGLTAYIEQELGRAPVPLAEVLPQYPPFGKRMLLDNGWFRALTRPHVRLVTGAVTEVRRDRIVTSDGSEHEADVLIWATGFDVVNFLAPMRVRGRGGRELHTDWDGDDARAYLGTVVPGYPNFFCLYGPNTQFGHGGSLITVLERQIHYVMSLLRQMFSLGLASIEVRQEVHDDYNKKVDSTHERMVWTFPGVESYCRNSKGRVVVNNPFRILDFWRMTEAADLGEYDCVGGSTGRGGLVGAGKG